MPLLPERRAEAFLISAVAALAATSCSGATPIEREIEKSPDKLTVVEFVDYECHFCQDLHGVLAPLLTEQEGRVRIVLKHVPLPEHPSAKKGAAAAICAEAQGKPMPMHDALMRGAGRSDDDVLDLAQRVGLDVETFKTCLRSDLPAARIASDTRDYESLGGDGLPMLFIQREKLVGMQDEATLEKALRKAP